MTRKGLIPLAFTLSACAAAPVAGPSRLVPAETGFLVEGTGLEIGFGRAREGAVAAASRAMGREPDGVSGTAECMTVRWADGLEMVFSGGAFVAWRDPLMRSGRAEAGTPCTA